MARGQGHIAHCLSRILSLWRDSTFIISGRRRRTGSEFVDGVRRLAAGLAESGVRAGDVVAVAALNSDQYIELLLAVTYIGAIVAPLNHRWNFEEARSAMELVQPAMLAVDESCSQWAMELKNSNNLPSSILYLLVGDCSPSLSSTGSFLTMDTIKRSSKGAITSEPTWAPKEIALICFTSGTTGRPKGVALGHTSLIVQSLAKMAIVGYGEDDVYLHTAPLCHIGGISSCISMLMAGGCHVLIPKFDAKSALEAIEGHKVTSFITVPAMMADLISYGRKGKTSDGGETVTKILNGGGTLSQDLIKGASCLFPHAAIVSAYGMTEACSSLTFMTLRNPRVEKSGELLPNKCVAESELHCQQQGGVCVGKAAPHIELRISGSHNDHFLPSVGKILTRGLHLMVGYWDTTKPIALDSIEYGWLDTGDIGWISENGDLWLMGREKDRIKSGGETVYPEEVEAVLYGHPGIAKIVVVGVPDIRLAEKVVACVKIKDDWKWFDTKFNHLGDEKVLSAEILRNYCRQRNLSRFKIPKTCMIWRKEFPVTTTGKIRREDVRKEAMSCMQLHSYL
ncbi:2-succinylbenzoate--CoA ligase, chloroplastic/peroxisomal [Typha angustifolia]|uniref:2-succinylbenzoate--CoA ligase, chloroplastic/peroxisomal n=1 Tax=Typha angustifolia TaxID=59011 RepID=UPI003C2D6CE1